MSHEHAKDSPAICCSAKEELIEARGCLKVVMKMTRDPDLLERGEKAMAEINGMLERLMAGCPLKLRKH